MQSNSWVKLQKENLTQVLYQLLQGFFPRWFGKLFLWFKYMLLICSQMKIHFQLLTAVSKKTQLERLSQARL